MALVVLNWNTPTLTRRLLESIPESDRRGLEIVLVDNGSNECPADLAHLFEVDQFVSLPRNLGYTGGMNAGLRQTTADWVAFCNSDVVLTEGTLAAARSVASELESDPEMRTVAAFGGIFLNVNSPATGPGNRRRLDINSAGYCLDVFLRSRQLTDEQIVSAHFVSGLSGALFFVSREYLRFTRCEEVLFDDSFGSYCEDKDLWLRTLRAGWVILFAPQIVAYHVGSASSGGETSLALKPTWIQRMALRNRIRTYYKNSTGLEFLILVPFAIGNTILYGFLQACRGRWKLARAAFLAAFKDWWWRWAPRTPDSRTTSATSPARRFATLRLLLRPPCEVGSRRTGVLRQHVSLD